MFTRKLLRNYSLYWDIKKFDNVQVEKDLPETLRKCQQLSNRRSCIGRNLDSASDKYAVLLHKLYAELEIRAVRGLINKEAFEATRKVLFSELVKSTPRSSHRESAFSVFEGSCTTTLIKNPILRHLIGIYDEGRAKLKKNPIELLSAHRFTNGGGCSFDTALKLAAKRTSIKV